MMKSKGTVTVKNRKYPYTLERTRAGNIRIVAQAAGLDQEFLPEDVSELLLDLPNLILAERAHRENRSEVIRFRVSGKDKKRIEKRAIAEGYGSVSQYVRASALR